ncbi:MAG: hypothetical protein AAF597_06875 [Bacteroidota bacterium]
MFTEIIAAGAMGVSVFFAIRAYSLLKEEQAKEAPRPTMLRSIYVFMGFALLMTPMALGIEYARHHMNLDNSDFDQQQVADALKKIENKTYYVLNRSGIPDSIELDYAGVTYQLGVPFPRTGFKGTHLKLKQEDQRFLAYKNNNEEGIIYGYLDENDLEAAYATIADPVAPPPTPTPVETDEKLTKEKQMAMGLMYTPSSPVRSNILNLITKRRASTKTANRYLVDFVSAIGRDEELQEAAVKILIQPAQMTALDDGQYQKLIDVLSKDGPRTPPWRYYELAQVYQTRSWQKGSKEDMDRYYSAMCAYKTSYLGLGFLSNNPEKYPLEKGWYDEAVSVLRAASCDGECNCSKK